MRKYHEHKKRAFSISFSAFQNRNILSNNGNMNFVHISYILHNFSLCLGSWKNNLKTHWKVKFCLEYCFCYLLLIQAVYYSKNKSSSSKSFTMFPLCKLNRIIYSRAFHYKSDLNKVRR